MRSYHRPETGNTSPRIAALRALEETPPAKLGISATAAWVAIKLAVRMNRVERRPVVWPKQSTIAADSGLSVRAVRLAIRELERAGLLRTLSRRATGSVNEYELDVAELCLRAGITLEPEPKPVQRELGPLLAEVARRRSTKP